MERRGRGEGGGGGEEGRRSDDGVELRGRSGEEEYSERRYSERRGFRLGHFCCKGVKREGRAGLQEWEREGETKGKMEVRGREGGEGIQGAVWSFKPPSHRF